MSKDSKFKRLILIIAKKKTIRSKKKTIFFITQIMVVIYVVAYCLETISGLTETQKTILYCIDIVSLMFFTLEYVFRLYIAKSKRKYIFSFFGIIDVLSILPFYFGNILDFRILRLFRLFRLFSILKLMRYSKAVERFKIALGIIKEEIILFTVMIFILLFLSSSCIYYFEHEAQPDKIKSIFDGLWWSMVTFTTVGYGDIYPITFGGRMFTLFMLVLGIVVITVPAGLISSALTEARYIQKEQNKKEELDEDT